jgi:hypothetical protein
MQRLIRQKIRILFITLFIVPVSLKATEWSCVVDLSGLWSFSVGDDQAWANPKTDVSDWDKIEAPGAWEEYYKDYNGFAWYRKNFDMHPFPENGTLYLLMGTIDDVDEVFINGVKVGQTGSFLPDYKTAWDVQRKYNIPGDLLKPSGNVIAVRVYDEGLTGGIIGGNEFGLYYDNDNSLLSLDLSGEWKFSTYREPDIYELKFNDDKWKKILVPSTWESQGYANHDGYGWYRKEFTVTQKLMNDDLYLSLGKIDDMDKVYLNGKLIGRTEELEFYSRFNRSDAWRMYRIYRIPDNLLKTKNILVVEVNDYQMQGGIIEGPIGIITPNNARILEDRNEEEYWPSNVIRSIINSFLNW